MTIFYVIDSDSGDTLGSIEVPDDAGDEQILETLVTTGYLSPPADMHEITDGDILSTGERCVRDEFGEPVLALMTDEPDDEEDYDSEESEDSTDMEDES